MKRMYKSLFVLVLGIFFGYYVCNNKMINNLFNNSYKAFQIGVYRDYSVAKTYKDKYSNSIIIKDMSKYLKKSNIEFYLRDINIKDKNLVKEINEYESIMDSKNEIVFLELNKLIIEKYKESL